MYMVIVVGSIPNGEFEIFRGVEFHHVTRCLQNKQIVELYIEAIHSAGAQSVTVKQTGCGFDLHSRR